MNVDTPFGNPDGSRSDLNELLEHFISFDQTRFGTGLGIRGDDLSVRIIVGAKGSGKTVYLRRLHAAAVANSSVYASSIEQELPTTSNIVKFCQVFRARDLSEKWMQLWYSAILRSVATVLLNEKELNARIAKPRIERIKSYQPDLLPGTSVPLPAYSQVTDIIRRFHTEHQFSKYFDDPRWPELSYYLAETLKDLPPLYVFLDSVDEEYSKAPMFWLQCQKGLFYRVMRFLRDHQFGGRLHVIACVRDHVLASVLRGEHQNRYRGEPHIRTLAWEYDASEFFLNQKVNLLNSRYLMGNKEKALGALDLWLGQGTIENRGRKVREPLGRYLLRHTRLLPRDIVSMGNMLCEQVLLAKNRGDTQVPAEKIRSVVRQMSRGFGNEQIEICANQVVSSSMPAEAGTKGFSDLYTGENEYVRSFGQKIKQIIRGVGCDRFDKITLRKAQRHAKRLFGKESDALSVLWQNRLLGYIDSTSDGEREVFFSEVDGDFFNLPEGKNEYLLHSCLIDSVGIRAVGSPIGGALPEGET